MKLEIYATRVFAGMCLLAAGAGAATPKGSYVLLDQGVAAGLSFSVLGNVQLDGAGNVTGTEVFRSSGSAIVASVAGTYTMSDANSGVMQITATQQDADEPLVFAQNYRFLATNGGELFAVRTDNGVLSTSTLSPAEGSPAKGSLALTELDRDAATGQAFALLAQLALDGNGAVSGKAWALRLSGSANASVSGSHAAATTGALGTLTLTFTVTDADGIELNTTYRYRTAATGAGVKAIRLDPGVVAVADLEAQ